MTNAPASDGEVRTQILNYIADFLLGEDGTQEVGSDTPLLSSGLIDSVAVEELLRFIEEEYELEFEEEELNAENFETVDRIAVLVERKRRAP
jgi:acyl carrier protein